MKTGTKRFIQCILLGYLFQLPYSYAVAHSLFPLTQDSTSKQDTVALNEITITADQKSVQTKSISTLSQALRGESQGKNLAEVLSDISGVSILKTGVNNSKPVINGLHGNRLILLNHGVRHESQQWGADHAPEIDPFSAQKISVIKSADAVRYGPDALAGIVLLEPSDINAQPHTQSSTALMFNSNGRGITVNSQLEGASHNFTYRVGLTAGKQGNQKTATYYLGNTGSNELNANAYIAYKFGKKALNVYFSHFGNTLGVFQGAHIGSKEDILDRIAQGKPSETYDFTYKIDAPNQHITHQLGKLQYQQQLSANSLLEAQYSLQRNHRKEYDLRRVAENNVPMADLVLLTQQLELVYSHSLFTAGASGSLQVNNSVPGTGVTPIIPNFENHSLAAFLSGKVPVNSLLIELGARYDYKYFDAAGYQYKYDEINPDGSVPQYLMADRKQFHNISGIAGISQRINTYFTWKSNLGLAWRAPSANELYSDGIHHGTGTYEIGNRHLKSEKGLKWVNSLLLTKGPLQVDVAIFAQLIDNYIYSQPLSDSTRQTIRGTFPLFQYRQDRAVFYGLDFSSTLDLSSNWQYGLNFALVNARNVSKDEFLPYIPAPRLQQHISYHFQSIKPETYFKVKHLFQARQVRYEAGADFASPPAAYHLFDAIIATTVKLEKQRKLSLQLAVENVLNASYKDYMDRFRYYAHALGRNASLKINLIF